MQYNKSCFRWRTDHRVLAATTRSFQIQVKNRKKTTIWEGRNDTHRIDIYIYKKHKHCSNWKIEPWRPRRQTMIVHYDFEFVFWIRSWPITYHMKKISYLVNSTLIWKYVKVTECITLPFSHLSATFVLHYSWHNVYWSSHRKISTTLFWLKITFFYKVQIYKS